MSSPSSATGTSVAPPPLAAGFESPKGCTALVTGSSGLVGARLVEMLLERGAKTVIAFDITPPNDTLQKRFDQAIQNNHKVTKMTGGRIIVLSGSQGDLCNEKAVHAAFTLPQVLGSSRGIIDVVYHIAALVGQLHHHAGNANSTSSTSKNNDRDCYYKVNVEGTLRIIDHCRRFQVPTLVYASSPCTRFTGDDIEGLRGEDMPYPSANKFIARYAETKAMGEMAILEAANNNNGKHRLRTVAIAPHQVYGPHDNLFLSNVLQVAGTGYLRIIGSGQNRVSLTYVDNYCHGLMCGADALLANHHHGDNNDNNDNDTSPAPPKATASALGKYYVVTDGGSHNLWGVLSQACVAMGFDSLESKVHTPVWILSSVAYLLSLLAKLAGDTDTGRRWGHRLMGMVQPFTVRMMTIHRWFDISNAQRDLKYEPIVPFEQAWPETLEWFREHWLPEWEQNKQQQQTQHEQGGSAIHG